MKIAFVRKLLWVWIFWCPAAVSWADGVIQLSIKSKIIQAELAVTDAERAAGLMCRQNLCRDCGMLFVFPKADKWAFWSKNTPLPLSLAYLDANGVVTQLVNMEPQSEESHHALHDVIYALEMRRGWFGENGITVGDSVIGLQRFQK